MEKAEITLAQLVSLLGPAAMVRIIDEAPAGKPCDPVILDRSDKKSKVTIDPKVIQSTVFFGHAVMVLKTDLKDRFIKHISPIDERSASGQRFIWIFIY